MRRTIAKAFGLDDATRLTLSLYLLWDFAMALAPAPPKCLCRFQGILLGGTGKLVCPWGFEWTGSIETAPSNKFGGATRRQNIFTDTFSRVYGRIVAENVRGLGMAPCL